MRRVHRVSPVGVIHVEAMRTHCGVCAMGSACSEAPGWDVEVIVAGRVPPSQRFFVVWTGR